MTPLCQSVFFSQVINSVSPSVSMSSTRSPTRVEVCAKFLAKMDTCAVKKLAGEMGYGKYDCGNLLLDMFECESDEMWQCGFDCPTNIIQTDKALAEEHVRAYMAESSPEESFEELMMQLYIGLFECEVSYMVNTGWGQKPYLQHYNEQAMYWKGRLDAVKRAEPVAVTAVEAAQVAAVNTVVNVVEVRLKAVEDRFKAAIAEAERKLDNALSRAKQPAAKRPRATKAKQPAAKSLDDFVEMCKAGLSFANVDELEAFVKSLPPL